ncbi:MAG: hypothetical protein K2W96_22345 [Gemmataceae bacterium]|nr:hypothetical protein [Gemmataceae bacterium]
MSRLTGCLAVLILVLGSGNAVGDPLISIPVTHGLSEKDRKIIQDFLEKIKDVPPELEKVLKKHVPILIPREWYEEQARTIEDQKRVIKALQEAARVDKLDSIQGAYHWAGKPCGIKIVDKKKATLEFHFPEGFGDGLGKAVVEGSLDQVTRKVTINFKGVIHTPYLIYKPDGGHILQFTKESWWTAGSAK